MTYVVLYLSTAAVFLVLDMFGLRYLLYPIFARNIGPLLADPPRVGPAAVFYMAFVAGVVWFVGMPALAADVPGQAFLAGAVLGLMCYGTYEFTNLATLKGWAWEQVIVDCLWGACLTGVSAWAGVMITRAIT